MGSLLRQTETVEGEMHACLARANHTCRYDRIHVKRTIKTLCKSGHRCRQCACTEPRSGMNALYCC